MPSMPSVWMCLFGRHKWGEIRRNPGTQFIKFRGGSWEPMYFMTCECCGKVKRGTKRELKYARGDRK